MMKNFFSWEILNTRHQKPHNGQINSLMIFASLFLILTMFFVVSCEVTYDFNEIRAEELKRLIDEKAPFLLVDNRSEYEYRDVRIPGAINIPQEKFRFLDKLLPEDKSFRIVFYCRGGG